MSRRGRCDRSLARSAWENVPRKNRPVGCGMIRAGVRTDSMKIFGDRSNVGAPLVYLPGVVSTAAEANRKTKANQDRLPGIRPVPRFSYPILLVVVVVLVLGWDGGGLPEIEAGSIWKAIGESFACPSNPENSRGRRRRRGREGSGDSETTLYLGNPCSRWGQVGCRRHVR
jgi:hypothetical protein